jgi:hypothetical protein
MSDPLIYQGQVLRKDRKYATASYTMGVNYVSPNDIAKAGIVSLVNRKEHRNKVYNLTAVNPIHDEDVCKLLSEFYGTNIEHDAIGYHQMEDELKKQGFPSWLVQGKWFLLPCKQFRYVSAVCSLTRSCFHYL